jgi:hypothetical protein
MTITSPNSTRSESLVDSLLGTDLQVTGELVVRSLTGLDDLPQVGAQELVSLGDGGKGGLQEVSLGGGGTLGLGVTVLDSGHLEESLGSGGGDDVSSSGCKEAGISEFVQFYYFVLILRLTSRDQSTHDGSSLSGNLARNGVRLLDVVSPVSPSDGDDGELGDNDGSPDGGSDFLGTLDSQTDVTVKVTDSYESLESGSLTGRGLLLDGSDGHDLVLESGKELVDDLVLLDGEREEVDLLHGLDLSVVHETSKLW